jgi:hypothetical protein
LRRKRILTMKIRRRTRYTHVAVPDAS